MDCTSSARAERQWREVLVERICGGAVACRIHEQIYGI
jgi:hypothetical protein